MQSAFLFKYTVKSDTNCFKKPIRRLRKNLAWHLACW